MYINSLLTHFLPLIDTLPTPIKTPLPGIPEPVMYHYMPQGPSDFDSMPDLGLGGDIKLGRPAIYKVSVCMY